ncbi:hypothetical protein TWF694_008351 [Orbilia ellipsospora]|uniref:Uncharacterized protein n=1 Tax=Orbilia ellipsospora TaxID=2528407 RepID=A0AAV9XFU2_9PEZI
MPEGLTVHDMTRMMKSRFKETNVTIEIHDRWFRNKDAATSSEATMPKTSFQTLSPLQGHSIRFNAENIQFHGKQMGIPFPNDIWVRVKFGQHGHCVVLRREEYDNLKNRWDTIVAKDLKHVESSLAKKDNLIKIPFSLVGDAQVMAFTDHTKWIQFFATVIPIPRTLFGSSYDQFYWVDRKNNGPCPIQEWEASQKNKYWNGIGASHANDILFLAMLHPAEKVSSVFNSSGKTKRLVAAIETFFSQARSDIYLKNVPSGSTAIRGFDVSDRITRWYNECFIKVYKKKTCLVAKEYFDLMVQRGLLKNASFESEGEKPQPILAKKSIFDNPIASEVAARTRNFDIIIPQLSHREKILSQKPEASVVEVVEVRKDGKTPRIKLPVHRVKWPGNRTPWAYGYTLINSWPERHEADHQVEQCNSNWKPLDWDNGKGEIGPTNFHYTIGAKKQRDTESKKTGRKVALRNEIAAAGGISKQRGRPQKGKRLEGDPAIDPNRKRKLVKLRRKRLEEFNLRKKQARLVVEEETEESIREELENGEEGISERESLEEETLEQIHEILPVDSLNAAAESAASLHEADGLYSMTLEDYEEYSDVMAARGEESGTEEPITCFSDVE